MKILKSKTRKELLNNTIKRYNLNNRAIENPKEENSTCFYYEKNSNKRCAIGIEVFKNTAIKLQKENGPIHYTSQFILLPKRLQKMGKDFLKHVQRLHDTKRNWNEKGLSEQGEDFVERIKREYNIK